MKKKFLFFVLVLAFSLLASGGGIMAQSRFGVIGGISFSTAEKQSLNRTTMNKYMAGVTYQLKLPLGFSVQPSLLYHVKGAKLEDALTGIEQYNTADLSIGYLELPVSLQWGPDLLLFRPFLDVTPYIGYGLNNSFNAHIDGGQIGSFTNRWSSVNLNRFEYGVGVGVGLEIWKFQLIGRYNWNMGSLSKADGADAAGDLGQNMLNTAFSDGHNFGGFTLSISILF